MLPVLADADHQVAETCQTPLAVQILPRRHIVDLSLREKVGWQIVKTEHRLELDFRLRIVDSRKISAAQTQMRGDRIRLFFEGSLEQLFRLVRSHDSKRR